MTLPVLLAQVAARWAHHQPPIHGWTPTESETEMSETINDPAHVLVSATKYARLVYATPEEMGYRGVAKQLTDAELADIRARDAAARKHREELHTRLRAATNDPGALAVLNLHAPGDKDLSACTGCPTDEMGCPEYWPCDTVEAVADAYGITITDEEEA